MLEAAPPHNLHGFFGETGPLNGRCVIEPMHMETYGDSSGILGLFSVRVFIKDQITGPPRRRSGLRPSLPERGGR